MRCAVIRGGSWLVLLSPCNTLTQQNPMQPASHRHSPARASLMHNQRSRCLSPAPMQHHDINTGTAKPSTKFSLRLRHQDKLPETYINREVVSNILFLALEGQMILEDHGRHQSTGMRGRLQRVPFRHVSCCLAVYHCVFPRPGSNMVASFTLL